MLERLKLYIWWQNMTTQVWCHFGGYLSIFKSQHWWWYCTSNSWCRKQIHFWENDIKRNYFARVNEEWIFILSSINETRKCCTTFELVEDPWSLISQHFFCDSIGSQDSWVLNWNWEFQSCWNVEKLTML